jgi:hypothetical protein
MSNIHLVTIATKPGGYLKWLEQSCKRNGTKLTILGMGSEWKGYITKCILVKEFLENLPEDDIVCIIDAYDVLMIQHVEILKDKFIKHTENTNYKLICAVDIISPNIGTKWYYGTEEDIIINAGTYIGFAGFIKDMYKKMIDLYNLNKVFSDDQFLLNKFYKNHKNEILIDTNKKFFYCESLHHIIHIKQKKDDYVFLHRPGNYEMISALIQYDYKFDINEVIKLGVNEIDLISKKGIGHLFHTLERSKVEENKYEKELGEI